jgi:hypothetical protein
MNRLSLLPRSYTQHSLWQILLVLTVLVVLALMTGCADNRWRAQEASQFYQSQQQLAQTRKPLFELKAQPGQTITLSGVESLTVNDPREAKVEALPEHRSQVLDTVLGIAKIGAEVYGVKEAADGVVKLAGVVGANGGNHSVTNITGSYNTQGDTLSGSIKGNVAGNGAGVGNVYRDGSTHVDGSGNGVGTGNNLQNGNENRQGSSGPTTGGASTCSGGAGDPGGTGASATGCLGGSAGG